MSARLVVLLGLMLLPAIASAQETIPSSPPVSDPFTMLEPLLGRTWRGEFAGTDKPVIDIQRWERALGGRAVRVLHSINDGAYGGETMIVWDESRRSLVYCYFTTAGFHTTGTMAQDSSRSFASTERVTGSANGVTEVRSSYVFNADGSFTSRSSYLKDGAWVGGREVTYREAPEETVILP